MDDFNIVLVECAPRALSLTSSACAADWRRSQLQKPFPWETRWHCRTCVLGAARAGVDASAAERTAQVDAVKAICVRCHQPCDRMLKNRWCCSCYNRELEMLKGKNGRGTFPTIVTERYNPRDFSIRFKKVDSSEWNFSQKVSRVANILEAMLVLLRSNNSPLYFSKPVSCVSGSAQITFWGGV